MMLLIVGELKFAAWINQSPHFLRSIIICYDHWLQMNRQRAHKANMDYFALVAKQVQQTGV